SPRVSFSKPCRNSRSRPAAYTPPTSEPLEEPATDATRRPRASSDSITPICASPRAPPAPSARAIGSPCPRPGACAATASALVVAQREREHCTRLRAQGFGLDDLRVAAVVQHVHQQFARRAVGHLQLVEAV